jgi:hypothetical protein
MVVSVFLPQPAKDNKAQIETAERNIDKLKFLNLFTPPPTGRLSTTAAALPRITLNQGYQIHVSMPLLFFGRNMGYMRKSFIQGNVPGVRGYAKIPSDKLYPIKR